MNMNIEYFIQAILKSADIRAIVKGVEVDYSVIIKVYIGLNDVFEKCMMIMIIKNLQNDKSTGYLLCHYISI